MDNTAERQRRYRERLYKAGFKQAYVWVKRKEGKTPVKMNMAEFVRQLKKQTTGMNEKHLTRLLNLMLKIAKGRKEEVKLREKK
jgi:flagellar biosynthesis/type III secretory pathway protein FliH